MVQLNPHLVAVNLNCYGHGGPWKIRSGFEQLAQTVSGMAIAQRENGIPQLGPTYPNDYLTGYLTTLGVLMALEIQGREGGAWQVDVSLCRTAIWVLQQGSLNHCRTTEPMDEAFAIRCIATETEPFREMQYFNTALELERTPLRFTSPVLPLGLRIPVWID